MKILGVDSSATAASAAIISDGKLLAVQFTNTGLTHSQTLMTLIDNAFKLAKLTPADIDAFAVSYGPGSFTGVRIGVAAVKGLAQPLGKKCLGVSTLEVIAKPLECSEVYAVAAMDARCNQVYTAQFDCKNGKMARVTPDSAITLDELLNQLKGVNKPVVLIGDGAELCYNRFSGELKNVTLAPAGIRCQSAASVALCACEAAESAFVAADELLPSYLRVSQAERELKNKKQSDN